MAEILKQNQGNKILRQNQGGKILKANYNFGRAFRATNANTYIQFNPPAISTYTALIFVNDPVQDTAIKILFSITQEGDDIILSSGSISYRNNFVNYNNSINVNPGIVMAGIRGYTTFTRMFANNTYNSGGTNGPAQTLGTMRISKGAQAVQFSGEPATAFFLFDRTLSDNELSFLYNKGLGNSPLIESGKIIEYRTNKAEILDFSEAQDNSDLRVGVRNFGSIVNGHGEIIGLPAGTLEEKRDYANTNLFVNFL